MEAELAKNLKVRGRAIGKAAVHLKKMTSSR
jgi:hypothetical protein